MFIDTPPAVTKAIAHVVSFADLVVMPTRPSPHDLHAVGATVEIGAAHHKAMIFVINAATARAKITSEAAVALSQQRTVAPVMINHRVDFAASMTDGRTVMEHSLKGPSSKEVQELWSYVENRLAKLDGGPVDFVDPASFDFDAPEDVVTGPAPQPRPQTDVSMVAPAEPVAETLPVRAELPPALDLVLRQIIETTESLAEEAPAIGDQGLRDDAAFDGGRVPLPLQENPQQALLEAVQRLRGELDYPISLEDILPPQAEAGEAIDPEQILREMASNKRGTGAPLLNRMIGFGRRA